MDDQARAFVANGSQVILSPADAVYLDMKYDETTPLGLAWANGPTSVQRAYSWEPTGLIEGIGEDGILGVEAPLWTETDPHPGRHRHAWRSRASPPPPRPPGHPPPARAPCARGRRSASASARLGPLWSSLGIRFYPSPEIEWAAE